MEYLAKFDENGRRLETVVEGIHYSNKNERQTYLNNNFIPITEEDWKFYCNGYIRDFSTGKPILVELKENPNNQKALKLRKEYAEDIYGIKNALLTALLNDDAELQKSLKEEYADLMSEYTRAFHKF